MTKKYKITQNIIIKTIKGIKNNFLFKKYMKNSKEPNIKHHKLLKINKISNVVVNLMKQLYKIHHKLNTNFNVKILKKKI